MFEVIKTMFAIVGMLGVFVTVVVFVVAVCKPDQSSSDHHHDLDDDLG